MRTLSTLQLSALVRAWAAIMVVFVLALSPQQAFANSKYAGIVIDAKTGKTLYSYKADATRYPASLTKMMTLYMMFEAIDDGKMSKRTRIRMSKYAASKPPSKLGIRPGKSLSAEQAILALTTKSANDVAAAVAEHLGGSEANFGRMMTKKARQLGMKRTTFRNASGLTNRGQVTTARDMARLGVALREHFPHHYKYFSTRVFKFGRNKYGNHNRLLGRVRGVDGIKTGYTRASGFNLVSSVQTGGRSIVAVVMGGRSGKSRNAQMQKLIRQYLRKASKGKKKMLLAARKPSGNIVLASAIKLPKKGPVPKFRTATPTVLAYNNTAQQRLVTAHAYQANIDVSNIDKIQAYLLKLNGKSVPVPEYRPASSTVVASAKPVLRPVTPLTASATGSAKATVDPVRTASVTKPSGWVIQIGAAESESGAHKLLAKARKKFGRTLKGTENYTETVAKGNSVLHRARFVGFASKSAARNACKTLKKNKFACLALSA